MKYYILKRNTPELADLFLRELDADKRAKMKVNPKDAFLLMEKTQVKDRDGSTTEHYTKVCTVAEGVNNLLYGITKNNNVFDYTGFVYPIIHFNRKPMTMEQYYSLKKQ